MNGLNIDNTLYEKLANNPPKWWRSIICDKDLSVQIRKDNTIDVYYNCGAIITVLKYGGGKFSGSISAKYIPLDRNYYSYNFSGNEAAKFPDGAINPVQLNNFCQKTLKTIKGQIRQYFPKTSEKGVQSDFIRNDSYFIDMEYEHGNDLRIDLIRLDFGLRKIVFVELKLMGNKEIYTNKIVEQLTKYSEYIRGNSSILIEYYKKVFEIKKKIGILSEELARKNIFDFGILDKPLLLFGDCEQAWIDDFSGILDEKIKDVAVGCYYFGKPNCSCEIINRTKANRHIFI
jgi:hypothetical protein